MNQLYELDGSVVHKTWDKNIAPRLTIESGDTVSFDTRDAADHYYSPNSVSEDIEKRGPFVGHPLPGPVYIIDAAPGDVLAIEVKAMEFTSNFGWTAVRKGRGLLPDHDIPGTFLQIWDITDGSHARMRQRDDIAVPVAPFAGIMGNALALDGAHSTMPPREVGGNMDNKHLTVGTTLYLPIQVPGALFSTGDAHAAQGDGECCVTAVETCAKITLKFNLLPDKNFAEPQLRTHGPLCVSTNIGSYYATTAQGPDLYANSQQAIRYMIEHLITERGLSWEEAYVLCSVAVDLKISELVDAPNWLVSAFLPECVFVT